MTNLSTTYMGLALRNPIIAGSSGLTNTVKHLKLLEDAGVGAVVLKSLFEEQINLEISNIVTSNEQNNSYPEAEDYIRHYTKNNSIQTYLDFIKEAKAAVSIPVIASINCISASDWSNFALDIEAAGADAIELNIYKLPLDRNISADMYDKKYIDILRLVRQKIKIPIAVKIGTNFSNLVRIVDQLYANGANSVVMFNRFYNPDINLETLEFTSSEVLSSPTDLARVLRWTGIVKGKLPYIEIAASTGIHNGNAAIKQILAGAQVVQLCSTLYRNGPDVIGEIKTTIEQFMHKWNFKTLDDFRGRMSYANIESPAVYERAQFIKYFSNRDTL